MIKLRLEIFSTDQFICKILGHLPTDYGGVSNDRRFQVGSIYNHTASSLVWIENKVSLGSNYTVIGKSRFEQWLWDQDGAEVSHYHSNNGIWNTAYYYHNCNEKGQTKSIMELVSSTGTHK